MITTKIWAAISTVATSQLCIIEPSTLRSRFPGGCLWGSTATFASPGYADSIYGQLVWAGGQGCESQSDVAGLTSGNESAALAPRRAKAAREWLLLSSVGRCSFAQKARAARRRGALALVVVDAADSLASSREVQRAAIGGGEGGPAGLVPTLFLGREAQPLVDFAAGVDGLAVELRWDLARPAVKLEAWFPAGSPAAMDLVRHLAPVARALGDSLIFRPHYHVQALPAGAPHGVIVQDCLYSLPQFCTEGLEGIHGAALLQEAMRQHCVREVSSTATDGFSEPWWAYVEHLTLHCPLEPGGACGRGALAASGADAGAVERCVAERGLALLEDDRESRAWWSSSQVVIRINDGRYSGPLNTVAISRALCRRLEGLPDTCAAFTPAVEAPAGPQAPLWVLIGWCIAVFLGSSTTMWVTRWLGSRCRRIRWKCA